MCASNDKSKKKKSKFRFVKWFFLVLIILTAAVFILLPVWISSQSGKELIVSKINDNIDGKLEIALLSMGWFKGIEIEQLQFNDTAGRTSVNIKKISSKPAYLSFLGSTPDLGKTIIEQPQIKIKMAEKIPSINAVPSHKKEAPKTDTVKSAAGIILAEIDLEIKDGTVQIELDSGQTVRFEQLAAKMDIKGFGKNNEFDVSMTVDDNSGNEPGKIKAEGKIKLPKQSKKGWSFEDTSGDFQIEIADLDLSLLNPIFNLADVPASAQGKLNADITADIDKGNIRKIVGQLHGSNLDVVVEPLGGDRIKTENLTANIDISGDDKMINFEQLDVSADWLDMIAKGTIAKDFKSQGKFEGNVNLDIASLAGLMPHTFRTKQGTKITSGLLQSKILAVSDNGTVKTTGNANISNLAAIANGKEISLSSPVSINWNIHSGKEKLTINKLSLASSFAAADCTGTSDNLTLTANADFSKMQAEVGQLFDFGGYRFAGSVKNNSQLAILKNKIQTDGSAKFSNLKISKDGLKATEPDASLQYSLDYNFDKQITFLKSFIFNGTMGKVSISDAALSADSQNADISAELDLAKLMPFAVMSGAVPSDFDFGGFVNAECNIAKKGTAIHIRTENLRIDKPRFTYQEQDFFKQEFVTIDFDGWFDTHRKTVAIDKIRLLSPQIKITKGYIKRKQTANLESIDGSFDYDIDLAAVSKIAAPFLPEGFQMFGKQQDNLSFNSTYPVDKPEKMLANLNAKTRLGFERANYMGLNFGKTKADIDINNGLMTIKPFATIVNRGTLRFGASANFGREPVLLKTPEPIFMLEKIRINKDMTSQALKYLNPIFADTTEVSGILNFYCNQLEIPLEAGRKNDIVVDGVISMEDVYLGGGGLISQIGQVVGSHSPNTKMEIMPTKFVLRNGRLHYDDMQMNFGDNPLNFAGDIYLNKKMNMAVTLPWTLGGRTARVGKNSTDRIKIPIDGTVDRPKINTDKLFEENAKRLLEQEAKKFLEKLLK